MKDAMQAFEISFSTELISDLRRRIERTRWPELRFDVGWERGTDDATLRELAAYWLDGYDFEAIQERLNRLNHLRGPIEGEQLHCVVYEGSGDRRLPLLLLHGWPGSFVEFLNAAELLRSPTDGVGFDLVVPSLPGFAFSDPPRESGMDGGRIAQRLHLLMRELGYERYGVQGGDWGAVIGTALALQQPNAVLGLHLNLIPGRPTAPEGETPSAAEREFLEFWDSWSYQNLGYHHIQSTRPHTLSYAQHDSPVGLLAWILEKLWAWSDHGEDLWETLDRDQVLTNVMLYWLPGRALTAASIYYEMEHSGYGFLAGRVGVPTGYARFPKEPVEPSARHGRTEMEPRPLHRTVARGALRRDGATSLLRKGCIGLLQQPVIHPAGSQVRGQVTSFASPVKRLRPRGVMRRPRSIS